MIAFTDMLIIPAKASGMKVPDNAEDYSPEEYPHFYVYERCQIGSPMPNPNSHWNNAKLISIIPDDEIKTVCFADLLEMGLEVGPVL